jgi:SAM-dependent methyltransferase
MAKVTQEGGKPLKAEHPQQGSSSEDEEPEKTGYGGAAYKKGYGSIDYWNDRYANWATSPYDWLFEWKHVKHVVGMFVDRNDRILLPGCGNAPFSGDMFDSGFENQINIDLSEEAIKTMKTINAGKRPSLAENSLIMDAMKTTYEDNSFDAIVDKSLIDTTVCMPDGKGMTKKFVKEMCRILKDGGVYVTMSLHKWNEVEPYLGDQSYANNGCKLASASVMLLNDSDEQPSSDAVIPDEKNYQCFVVSMKLPLSASDDDVKRAKAALVRALEPHDNTAAWMDQEARIKTIESNRRRSRIAFCLKLVHKGHKEREDFSRDDVSFYKNFLLEKGGHSSSDGGDDGGKIDVCTSIMAAMLCERLGEKPPEWAHRKESGD